MGRLNVTHLKPIHEYRQVGSRSAARTDFTLEDAIEEDRLRLRRITRALDQQRGGRKKQLQKLHDKLDYVGPELPATLASAACFFSARQSILDHLVRLVAEKSHGPVAFGTLIPANARFPAGDLEGLHARKFMRRLKADADRAGASTADGYLFAALHGEYRSADRVWDPHYHFVVTGGMIEVAEQLRCQPKYKPSRLGDSLFAPAAPALHMQRLKRSEARHALSYLLQHYWPARWSGTSSDGNRIKGPRTRVPEPFHTDWLLWMDKQKLQDLILLMHLDVRREGLSVNTPKTRASIAEAGRA